jgi:cell filamentation protein
MGSQTNWTPGAHDNKLGLTDTDEINRIEAEGLIDAGLFIFDQDESTTVTAQLILEIHRIAFQRLYDWAGKWRTEEVQVGNLFPPHPARIPILMYQYIDNLNHRISFARDRSAHIDCISYAHHEFVRIHPFNNGNGRTGRLLMNLVCLILGYHPLNLYQRDGEPRQTYISALQRADAGDLLPLQALIDRELELL